ncbi:cold-regulated protein 27-like isoform X2 [Macadamia integrifolia]|uniref:cold-regulated protein 27-like isoform X2 n=1 Tax=Macadamia integrifolia TaxID=60698 RepID=UPI001C532C19|nr:cold-regulated protein 27-like isoform X2 [Macadamia integrifolia]
MEGNLRQGTPPPSSDPAMESSCRRTTGSETSGLTGDNFRTLLEEEEEEEMDSLMAGSMFTEWTDEKHSLYLNSMEELFVKQLHDEKELLAGHSENETMLQRNSSGQLNENNHVSSGQFKVLWNGCWRKNNIERIQPQSIIASDHHGLSKNPWIQHFRCSGRQGDVKSAVPEGNGSLFTQAVRLGGTNRTSCGVVTSSKRIPADQPLLVHQDFVGSNTEVSDQNFIEEDHDGEKCSSVRSTKRMKTVTADVSSKDQVVLHGKFPLISDYDENCASMRTEETGSSGSNQKMKYICMPKICTAYQS